MKFINRNAYIVVAVKGTSYCVSAGRAIQLLIMNALRLAAVNTVGDALTWLGKVCILLKTGRQSEGVRGSPVPHAATSVIGFR
jgi:hypothetical protein